MTITPELNDMLVKAITEVLKVDKTFHVAVHEVLMTVTFAKEVNKTNVGMPSMPSWVYTISGTHTSICFDEPKMGSVRILHHGFVFSNEVS